jgi:hypothetical protein
MHSAPCPFVTRPFFCRFLLISSVTALPFDASVGLLTQQEPVATDPSCALIKGTDHQTRTRQCRRLSLVYENRRTIKPEAINDTARSVIYFKKGQVRGRVTLYLFKRDMHPPSRCYLQLLLDFRFSVIMFDYFNAARMSDV